MATLVEQPVDVLKRCRDNVTADVSSTDSFHDAIQHPSKFVRRGRSTGSLRRQMSSTDSFESEQDSIYNAEAVKSRESLRVPSASKRSRNNSANASGNSSRSISSRSPHNDVLLSHSRWPTPHLNPIFEHNSIRSIRPSRSLPRLSASPERKSQVVQPQASFHSVRPIHRSPRRKQGPLSRTLYRQRSRSLNDLARIRERNADEVSHSHSSSSCDALDAPPWCRSFPLRPTCSPPHRVATPPGLPSFGTQEATEYRLTEQPPTNRLSLWHRIWRHSHDESDDQIIGGPSLVTSPTIGPQNQSMSPSSEIFKRTLAMMGMSRMVSPPLPASSNPRVGLPPGVYTAATSGSLAQADDGTFVRGRFGPRTSGHGVGSRNLESHPIFQAGQLASIHEQVREIDKACERADLEDALVQSVSPGPQHQQEEFGLPPPLLEGREDPRRSELYSGTDVHGSPPIYLSPPPMESAARLEFPRPSLFPNNQPPEWLSMGISSPPPSVPPDARQDMVYIPPHLLSLRSTDTMTGISSIDEEERAQVREFMLNEKRRRQQRKTWAHLWEAANDCCQTFSEVLCGCCHPGPSQPF